MVGSGKKLDFWFWVKVAVVGFMLVFLIYPFCTLITRSFFSTKVDGFTFENYIRFFTKKYYYSALGRSIFVSVVTTITTLVVGVPIAYVMSRYNVWGKQFIHIFIIMSLMSRHLSAPTAGSCCLDVLSGDKYVFPVWYPSSKYLRKTGYHPGIYF